MKNIVRICVFALMLSGIVSCNGNYRFVISPRPISHPVIHAVRPSTEHIWIDGEWFWNGQSYSWHEGYWTIPRDGYRWKPGSWRKRNNGWYWNRGHWKK